MAHSSTDSSFSGEIKVASRIIDYLSSGLYHTPAACLKELVNNSYDARATRVDVFVKPDADRIIVVDDGDGMSKEDFEKHFNRISESHKRDGGDETKGEPPTGGRPKIGKIGIGLVAANELCEVLEIFSTKKGSSELLHVSINFGAMRTPLDERRRGENDFVKADYQGDIEEADPDAHYTQLFLTEVRGPARDILAGASSQNVKPARSLYGLKMESVAQALKDSKLTSWKEFDPYSETMLHVGLNIPVRYSQGWVPTNFHNKVKDFEEVVEALNFSVFYDGSELRKPTIFAPPGRALIDRFEFEGEHVSARGYFYAQHTTVRPNDLQGLLVRIRNAAVGEYDHSFWGFSPSDASIIQRWISAEVWTDNRLEDAMNIDRRTLRVAHPAYVELREAIHKHLRSVLYQARTKLYDVGSTERKEKRTRDNAEALEAFAKEVLEPIAPTAAHNLRRSIKKAVSSPTTQKKLQHKFALTEFYETVVDVAEEVLTPEQLALFLERLTERLEK